MVSTEFYMKAPNLQYLQAATCCWNQGMSYNMAITTHYSRISASIRHINASYRPQQLSTWTCITQYHMHFQQAELSQEIRRYFTFIS